MSAVSYFAPLFAQAADHAERLPTMLEFPLGPKLAFSIVVLGLLIWGLKNPQVWVIVSVLAIGIGIGAAGYGITLFSSLVDPKPAQTVEHAALAIGGGAGGAIGGFVLLIVAILRIRMNAENKQ